MNREINFRIWDIENKEMLKVQELDFEPTFYGGRIAIRPDQYSDYFDTEDMILMQYTGLHDKNGKEIYEGDIIHINDDFLNKFNYLIEWNEEYLRYYLYSVDKEKLNKLGGILEAHLGSLEIEVIGNIYDNPELLGGK